MRLHRARAALAALVTATLVGLVALPASADQYDDQKAQNQARQKAVDAAMSELESALEGTSAALVQAYAELQGIQAQIPVAEQQLQVAQDTLARLEREAAIIADRLTVAKGEEATITGQIDADTTRADQTRQAIGQMARDAYKGDMAASSLSAVLDSKSTDEFAEQSELASTALRTQTQALRDLEQITGVNRNRQARLTAVKEQITALKAEADQKVTEAEAARAAAAQHKKDLEALQAQATAKAAEIEAQKATQLAQQQELEAQQAQLKADLQQIVAAQAEKRRQEAAAAEAARKAAAAAGKPAPPNGGYSQPSTNADKPFINPTSIVPMVVTSDYGMRFHPILHYWRLHAGVDLRTWCNTPVYAAASGTVQWTQTRFGFGNQVMINHGYWKGASLMSSYNHLTSFATRAGAQVSAGDLIGYSGNSGTSEACHLHFEVYVNGATVDPRPMINA
jgi:murein DD-endopeptidase MepM/ murein hydrolase activator NlpD